jgi:hypothetical protein
MMAKMPEDVKILTSSGILAIIRSATLLFMFFLLVFNWLSLQNASWKLTN